MKRLATILGVLAVAAVPSFATTEYAFLDSRASSPNTLSWNSHSYDVSPYSGAFGTNSSEGGSGNSAANLYCDDFAGTASYNSSWQVNYNTVGGLNSTTLAQTRYGSAVPTGSTYHYPTGTTLYQEIAWLFTQASSSSTSSDNQDTIQEAVWKLTGAANSTPNTNYTTSAQIAAGDKTIDTWISLAANNYSNTVSVSGYLVPDYNKWYVVTAVGTAGVSSGAGIQEFLAYKTGSGGLPIVGSAPEPATFVIAGSALLFLGFRRRKLASRQ